MTAGKCFKIKVDGREYATRHAVLLGALKEIGIEIPTLCHHPDLPPLSTCRLCLVEVNGQIKTSCDQQVFAGMEVVTNSSRILRERRTNLGLLLANHPFECEDCPSNGRCELQKLAEEFGLSEFKAEGMKRSLPKDESSTALVFDPKKCVLCERCVEVCSSQETNILSLVNRGWETIVAPEGGAKFSDTPCVYCGRCTLYCPTGAMMEKSEVEDVIAALNNPKKKVVVQVAPSIRVTAGEEFGMPAGSIVTKKIPAALRLCGFDSVVDTSFGADLTIMEEAHELIEHIKNGRALPLFTSCCPAWVYFVEYFYPELAENLSTAKSPQGMGSAIIKTYFAEKKGWGPKDIVSVSIMPCVAKKAEARRVEMKTGGMPSVDYVLTTREFAHLLREMGVNLSKVQDSDFDCPLCNATGAGQIFGSTGGVMEAVLRTAGWMLTGKNLKLEYKEVRGLAGIKVAKVALGKTKINVAVVQGLKNAEKIIDEIKNKNNPRSLHFVEVMACLGGCIGGAGQPLPQRMEKVKARMNAIYEIDRKEGKRRSHESPMIGQIYRDFLGRPGSGKAHELLHTHYTKRDRYSP